MAYQTLKSIYYQDKALYQRERDNRSRFFSAVHLPLPINGNPAYLMPTVDLLNSLEAIHLNLIRLTKAYQSLPGVSQNQYAKSCLLDEIKFTNDIEGVQSTRHEILAAYEVIKKEAKADKTTRFLGLVNKYNKLMEGETIALSTASDARALYDEIIAPEIAAKDLPDGKLFRKETVSILTPAQKVIHQGIDGEDNIIHAMDTALSVLNAEMPELVKIAVLHYYIGYIHPFYDGNGRLDRFISSYLLSKTYDALISYRLSYIIKKERTRYYKAFDLCNDPLNDGDLTPFILTFMEIVKEAIDSVLEKVLDSKESLTYYQQIIRGLQTTAFNQKILSLLVQNALFSNTPFDSVELGELLDKNPTTIKRNIKKMQAEGFPVSIQKSGRKDTYHINLKALESL